MNAQLLQFKFNTIVMKKERSLIKKDVPNV